MRENCPSGFDEREQETEPGQTGLRGRGESRVAHPPGDYRHCACSRLYSLLHSNAPAEVLSARPSSLCRFRYSSGDRRSCRVRKALVNVENLCSHILDSHRIKAFQVFV